MLSERQVQYALLQDSKLLTKILSTRFKLLAAYLDLSAWGYIGEVDFVLETEAGEILIVELETQVRSRAKVEHIVEQVQRYARAGTAIYGQQVAMIVLVAESPRKYLQQLEKDLKMILGDIGVSYKIIVYDFESVTSTYQDLRSRDERVLGWFAGELTVRSVASLGQLNEVFYQFKDVDASSMSREELMQRVTWKTSGTLVHRLHVSQEIGLIEDRRSQVVRLTHEGTKFRDYVNYPYRLPNGNYLDLSEPQKRIVRQNIIRIVRETGGYRNHLATQLICFLRFVALLGGRYIVLSPTQQLPDDVRSIAARIVGKSSEPPWKRASAFVAWTQKYCTNLDLIYLLEDPPYHRALFTDIGAHFYRILSDQLNMLREEASMAFY